MKDQKPELLAPAGSFRSLQAAVEAGADAVYASGKRFGARAYAENLDSYELKEAIDYVHLHDRKFYLTINTLCKDQEMNELFSYLLPYYEQGLDAVIVQDVGVFSFLRRQFPDLPVHISTQLTITGAEGVSFFAERGARRIILSRELSLDEIRRIRREVDSREDVPPIELECFVHGALCYCYSGQCLLSSLIGGRSGNRGQCAQPCRLIYTENGRKTGSFLSMKDLCTLTHLPDLVDAGIDSFKIEGRMKQPAYVSAVTSIYRKYLDLYMEMKRSGDPAAFQISQKDLDQLQDAYQRRGYTDGYLYRQNGRELISLARPETDRPTECATNAIHLQEKVNGNLMLSAGSRATLYLECKGVSVSCQGDVAEKAENQPLQPEQIEKQMKKTGGTPFVFQDLELTISGDVFLPVQALNRLRREGLKALQEAMLSRFLRDPVKKIWTLPEKTGSAPAEEDRPKLAVLVSAPAQLLAALTSEHVSRIYVDAEIAFTRETLSSVQGCQKEVCLAMPCVFREQTRERFDSLYESILTCYDGVLVRNWDAYAWLFARKYPGRITADQNLYVWNRESVRFLNQAGLDAWTAPAELNAAELRELGIQEQTMVVYGYQPVMISANCIRKTTGGCLRNGEKSKAARSDGSWMTLTDASHHSFAVRNVCSYCYNVLYNGVPLALLDEAGEVCAMHPEFVRLDFTRETKEETEKLIADYADRFLVNTRSSNMTNEKKPAMPSNGFTRGHFKRGVT